MDFCIGADLPHIDVSIDPPKVFEDGPLKTFEFFGRDIDVGILLFLVMDIVVYYLED